MIKRSEDSLLLGEWACLGIIYVEPMHGFAVAAKLKPDSDIGRVWTLSRALTYRAIDKLLERGLIEPVAEEQGIAGGNRTIYRCTRAGRAAFRRWLQTPVAHVRDLRSELLLKLMLGAESDVDLKPMIYGQKQIATSQLSQIKSEIRQSPNDPVARWRLETTEAALRFLSRL